jgi:hypothetical protein
VLHFIPDDDLQPIASTRFGDRDANAPCT